MLEEEFSLCVAPSFYQVRMTFPPEVLHEDLCSCSIDLNRPTKNQSLASGNGVTMISLDRCSSNSSVLVKTRRAC